MSSLIVAEKQPHTKDLVMKIQIQDLQCPISMSIFREPYVASDGFTYELGVIKHMEMIGKPSPYTREKITYVTENKLMKEIVEQFLEMYPQYKEDQYPILFDSTTFTSILVKNNGKEIIEYLDQFPVEEINDFEVIDRWQLNGEGPSINIPFLIVVTKYSKDIELFQYLFRRGIDLNGSYINPDGLWIKLIHIAIDYSTPEIIQFFLERSTVDDLFHCVMILSTEDRCKIFVEKFLDVEKIENGLTPLHIALFFNASLEIIQMILNKGADKEAESIDGFKPIHYAFQYSEPVVVKLLLEHGVNLDSLRHPPEGFEPQFPIEDFVSL